MRLWRIESLEFLPTALKGVGAEMFGGRWNQKGTRLLYLSSSLSLAAQEKFVHVPRSARYTGLVALGVDVPDKEVLNATRPKPLPPAWRSPETQPPSQIWGSAWAANGSTLAAVVPSIVLPLDLYEGSLEFNVLVNPQHAAMASVIVAAELPYHFDPRAWKD